MSITSAAERTFLRASRSSVVDDDDPELLDLPEFELLLDDSDPADDSYGALSSAMSATVESWPDLLDTSAFASAIRSKGGVAIDRAKETAVTILSEMIAAGVPLSMGLAAVANALAESGLDPSAMGDRDKDGVAHAVGVFQIQDLGGKRKLNGDRTDVAWSTRWIIEEMRAHEDDTRQKQSYEDEFGQRKYTYVPMESLRHATSRDATPAELAGLFSFHVERPARQLEEKKKREALARTMFPSVANLPASEVDVLAKGAEAPSPGWLPSIVSSWLEVPPLPTTGFFEADLSGYELLGADGRRRAQGEVPAGMYTVLLDGARQRTGSGRELVLNVAPGHRYRLSHGVLSQVS